VKKSPFSRVAMERADVEDSVAEAVERAIDRLVADFQLHNNRFWNERDLHCSLFYYIRQEGIVQEDYPTQLIRAELPTVRRYDGQRGHYDLALLDRELWRRETLQVVKGRDPWVRYLDLVRVSVAIELRLWLSRLRPDRVESDIGKLTLPENGVRSAYLVNLVQLDFAQPAIRDYYRVLRAYLVKKTQPGLKIVCVPSEAAVQPDPRDNWLPSRH
jgi:hypothetical protein